MGKTVYRCWRCTQLIGNTRAIDANPQIAMNEPGTDFNRFGTYKEFVAHMKLIHQENYESDLKALSNCVCWEGGAGSWG